VAHHEAEVVAALFGEVGSSDAEYGGEEAAEDEAAAECVPCLLLLSYLLLDHCSLLTVALLSITVVIVKIHERSSFVTTLHKTNAEAIDNAVCKLS
jgi:hypothetical protein